METPGAGPSRPRPPPPTVEPTTPKSRRRSWFHFGTSSSTPPPPLPLLPTSRRSSNTNDGDEGGEELELGSMTPRQSRDSTRVPLPSVNQELEGLELLTIDGEVDDVKEQQRTLKKKKKRRSKGGGGDEDEGEVVRMMDLKPHGLGPRRPSNSSDASGRTEVPNGRTGVHAQTFSTRTFSRTASDRMTYPAEAGSEMIKPPPRTTSIPLYPPPYANVRMDRTASGSSNKEQPPLPSERPLPPLPPDRASTPPTAPTGIYVTPSSPTRDTHNQEHDYHSLGAQVSRIHPQPHPARRSSSNDSRPGSRSNGRTGSPIGLGLPTLRPSGLSDLPPPVPEKRQSVSSPMPTRSSSPAQKISFVEPQEIILDERGRTAVTQTDEKRQKVRRARSLSGIFKSSPVIPSPSPIASRPTTPDPTAKEETGKSTGGGGVLEWLGVRKTVKRRQSETHLRQNNKAGVATSPAESAQAPRVPSPAPRGSTDSHAYSARGRNSQGSFGDLTSLNRNTSSQDLESGRGQSSRPSSRTSNSQSTTRPAVATIPTSSSTSSSKLGSLFSRRQTSKRSEGISPSPPASLPSNSGISPRDSGVASSRSSFSLPPFDPVVSPIYPNSGPWMASPAAETDAEEMLFSPEGGSNWGPGRRPWMDGTEQQAQSQRSNRSSFSSPPLGSLPEQSTPHQGLATGAVPLKPVQEGRIRSHSDAPQPSAITIAESRPMSGSGGSAEISSPGPRMAASLHSSPVLPGRPKLGNRANSGNAAIIDRMKTVFARSSSRQRASTLLPERQPVSQYTYTDEFGQLRTSSEWPSNGSSISGTGSSPRHSQGRLSADDPSQPQHSILGLQDAERRRERMSTETDGSKRSSVASSQSGNQSIRLPSSDIRREGSLVSRARPRASTVSVGPTTQAFVPSLEPPVIYPAAATPPRRRPSAIRKLSNTLLGAGSKSSTSSPKSTSLFPLPPRSSGSLSSSLNNSGFHWEEPTPPPGGTGTSASPRPSMGSFTAPSASISTSSASTTGGTGPILNLKQIAARDGDESADDYVRRVSLAVPRNEIAGVLATSSDEFHIEALRQYMTRFDFLHQPLDVALRQLLMHMSLPKETQQIDRVVEAFAVRYEQCEPDLFRHKDNTYVVAFSMMMLHTDAFNRHNKNKMSKADYVRNTRLDGVSPLVLEAFYDNITFSPFVFIEDDADLLPAPIPAADNTSPASMPPPRSGKVDIYHMIVNKLLHTLRLHIERQIPAESPYSTSGTMPCLDTDDLHVAFSKAPLLKVMLPGKRKTSTGILSSTPSRGAPPVEVVLKITRAAVLSRMDDSSENVKKANRKWKPWSVILTGSQIMFVKDSIMAMTILDRIDRFARGQASQSGADIPPILPAIPLFKPDEVISLKDCIAVYDGTPSRSIPALGQTYTFRLVMPHGRQYLLAATDEAEMNAWISHINYASAFKTAGIRMRGLSMDKEQVVLAGAAAAASHKRDMQVQEHAQGPNRAADANASTPNIEITTPKKAVFGDPTARSYTDTSPLSKSSTEAVRLEANLGAVDVGIDVDGGMDEGEQLEEVFDVVKAELAAGRGPGPSVGKNRQRPPSSATSEKSTASGSVLHRLPNLARSFGSGNGVGEDEDQAGLQHADHRQSAQEARTAACQAQLDRLEAKRTEISTQLSISLATARNLAILTPFQKTTRDRLSSLIPSLANQIRTERIQLAKYESYISILKRDLEKEQQQWATVRHVALQAAAKSLRDPKGVKAILDDVNQPVTRMDLPRLSLPDEDTDTELPSTSSLTPSPIWSSLPSPTSISPGPMQGDVFSEYRRPTVAPRQASGSSHHQEPRRSSSSASADHRLPSSGSTTTGTSTPMMFNLSENEDQTEADVGRGGTLKGKPHKKPVRVSSHSSMKGETSGPRNGTLKKSSRSKKEREVTAVFIGRELGPGQGDQHEGA